MSRTSSLGSDRLAAARSDREGVVEDLERALVTNRKLERDAEARVDDADRECVVPRIPEERDLQPVALPVGELLPVHDQIVPRVRNVVRTPA